jgi:hypothetical protein
VNGRSCHPLEQRAQLVDQPIAVESRRHEDATGVAKPPRERAVPVNPEQRIGRSHGIAGRDQ